MSRPKRHDSHQTVSGKPGAVQSAGVKEPFFYCSDLSLSHIPWRVSKWRDYVKIFESAPFSSDYLGDASPWYLFSERAIPRILADSSKARFVVMLRNPIELAHSLHNQRLKYNSEVWDFEEAWRFQGKRQQGQNLPKGFTDGKLFQYGEVAKLGAQVERLFDRVNREQIYLIIYDDFVDDPAGCYARLIEWLGLPADERSEFPRLNPSIGYRWPALERGLRQIRRVRTRVGIPGGIGIHAAINRMNANHQREPMSPAFRRELTDFFRDDVALLSRLLERDFSAWLKLTIKG
ncbi:MAG: sulfotransferase [Gammaproteobacteria bacterium]